MEGIEERTAGKRYTFDTSHRCEWARGEHSMLLQGRSSRQLPLRFGLLDRMPQPGWLTDDKMDFLQFWDLGGQDRGAGVVS